MIEQLNEPNEQQDELEQEQMLFELGRNLRDLFEKNARLREADERRMLKSLRQYYGQYDGDEVSFTSETNTSQAFINITRNKTNAAAARLQEMLLPNNGNEKNWGIRATVVPELEGMDNDKTPVVINEGMPDEFETEQGDVVKAKRAEARKKADAMEMEIQDQLEESNYAAIQRDLIFDACRLGTGVVKGPVLIGRERRVWQQIEGSNVYELSVVRDLRPRSKYVNPLFWYPDMSATMPDEREFDFEVSFITKRGLRELLKYPGYLKKQIKAALAMKPSESQKGVTSFFREVRELTGDRNAITDNRYHLLEYYGPIKREFLIACGCQDDELPEDQDEPFGVVIMVGEVVIKADIHPMAKGESIYDVFNWEENESSLFGFGVPHQMETEQRVINAAYRMVLDNGGLSTGPQILIRKGYVTPQNGTYELEPRKVWLAEETADGTRLEDIIRVFDIPSRLGDLMQIADKFRQLSDEVTNLPLIAQGEQSGNITHTYQGMALLMNSANIVIRRAVKSYDDWITKPHIGRYYDWNMEFNDKAEIKGDLEVIARGTNALLQREQELQSMTTLIQLLPVFAGKANMDEIWRRFLELNSLDPDTYTMPAEAEPQEPPVDPAIELKVKQLEIDAKFNQGRLNNEMAQIQQNYEVAMAKIAAEREITLEQLYKKLGMEQQKLDVQAEIKANESINTQNEMALKMQVGQGI